MPTTHTYRGLPSSLKLNQKRVEKKRKFIYLRFGAASNESICSVLCIFSCGFALAPSHSISFVWTNGERVVNDSNLWRAVAYIFIVKWIARKSSNCICPIPPVRIWFRLRRVQFMWSDRFCCFASDVDLRKPFSLQSWPAPNHKFLIHFRQLHVDESKWRLREKDRKETIEMSESNLSDSGTAVQG